jgi:peptide/nickel transport system permease protein
MGFVMFVNYLVKRIATMVIIFVIILNIQFLFFWVISPIPPVQQVIDSNFSPDLVDRLRKMYGLDQPLYVQYTKYIINMMTLNFGVSFRTQGPVIELIREYLPYTLSLILTAAILQISLGVLIGLYAAAKRGNLVGISITGIGLLMYALPSFLVLLFFRYIFAERLGWFPVIGVVAPTDNLLAYIQEFMYRLALPLIALVCYGFGSWAFYARNLSLEVLTQDFIQTARAKGLEEKKLLLRHVFPAILPPLVTLVLISIPSTIFGSIVCEYVFSWKGIGWWYLNSLWSGDYPSVQALFFIYSMMLLVSNLLSDILYGYLDPRIRVGERR